MRRWIALFLLCLLPLQWSYAAAAEYCQHEETRAAQKHMGHHSHEHIGDEQEPSKSKGYADQDCPTCHAHNLSVPLTAQPAQFGVETDSPDFEIQTRVPYRSPDNPFRPPLRTLA